MQQISYYDRSSIPKAEVDSTVQSGVLTPTEHNILRVDAKFLSMHDQRFYIRGTSYGSFAPVGQGVPFPLPNVVRQDFQLMRQGGINTVRLYDLPPNWLLDMAQEAGLYVILGVPWAQHLCLDRAGRRAVSEQIYLASRKYAQHPAVLMLCVGNEIPSPIVRWYGKRKTERFIGDMCAAARDAAPQTLVTYANYPTTEYLELPFLDVVSFNVYLHEQRPFQKYLAHLHVLAGERPLLLSELGMDSLHHGEDEQAAFLHAQLRDTFDHGLCGAITFSWTDEWFRNNQQVTDWAFGLVDEQRRPKAAYTSVRETFAATPFDCERNWPKISVVVAAYNAASTLDDCLASLACLDYPDYEVIVVNDGSYDGTGAIADAYAAQRENFHVIHQSNGGLSVARNIGLARSHGAIVAYTDADCRVDSNWLHYLALTLMNKNVVGAGGPNLVPPDDEWIAQCVAKAPGNPLHILLDDEIAEHIPGCNMAFWRHALEEVGGFHPDYRVAGDDVDLCWRLQAKGHQIGFSPSAIVWHHRRSSISAYLKQQVGYGQSEAILEDHHPGKFNHIGQVRWLGSIYGTANFPSPTQRYRIFYGKFGSAPFQPLERQMPSWWLFLPQMPEWYAIIALLSVAALALPWLWIFLLVALGLTLLSAIQGSRTAGSPNKATFMQQLSYRGLITLLHLLQPPARTWGRLKGGLGPLRFATKAGYRNQPKRASWRHLRRVLGSVGTFEVSFWSESGADRESFLHNVMDHLQRRRLSVSTGTGWEAWDLLVLGSTGERSYLESTVEYHGGPKSLLRLRNRHRLSRRMLFAGLIFGLLAARHLDFGAGALAIIEHAPYRILEMLTLLLSLVWFFWLLAGRIRLGAEILAAIEQVAQAMRLISLHPQSTSKTLAGMMSMDAVQPEAEPVSSRVSVD